VFDDQGRIGNSDRIGEERQIGDSEWIDDEQKVKIRNVNIM
jgi:hypothetical protein